MKYFGIGISRTGTSSLAKAFKLLGYNTKHYLTDVQYNYTTGLAPNEFDFMNDMPVFWKYKELDKKFPNSKFIYTERNIEQWAESCKRYFIDRALPNLEFRTRLHAFFKNQNVVDVDYAQIYKQHRDEVFEYFKERPRDLLVMNISK